jgi:hypothetical protein
VGNTRADTSLACRTITRSRPEPRVSLAVRVSENTKMTSTFLHEDKNVPPDEAVERDAPPCASCGQQMWLVRVDTKLSDGGSRTKREYECSHCGARQAVQTASECISPLASGETSVLVPGRARKRGRRTAMKARL